MLLANLTYRPFFIVLFYRYANGPARQYILSQN